LGCDPLNEAAVSRVLALKSRPENKGLILIAADIKQLAAYTAGLEKKKLKLIIESQGKGMTWLIPNLGVAPDWITGGQATLAVRVSNHPSVVGICEAYGGAMVSTSANPGGRPAATNLITVHRYFPNLIDVIVPGTTAGQNGPTEIRELETGRIIRPKQT